MFLLALLVSRAGAQVPHIDHLAIDDPTGRLTIFGSFGWTPGTVTIDSVLTPWSFWSVDSIVCSIPDNGRGSCGAILVTNSTGPSNGRILSSWDVGYSYSFDSPYGEEGTGLHAKFRLDLINALNLTPRTGVWTDTISSFHTYSGPGNGKPLTSDTTIYGSRSLGLDLVGRKIYLGFGVGGSGTQAIVPLDHRFNVVGGQSYMGPHETVNISGSAAFIPPDSELILADVSPTHKTEEANTFTAWTAGHVLNVRILTTTSNQKLLIIDALGRIVASYSIPARVSDLSLSIHLPSGVYFAEMEGTSRKFVILP